MGSIYEPHQIHTPATTWTTSPTADGRKRTNMRRYQNEERNLRVEGREWDGVQVLRPDAFRPRSIPDRTATTSTQRRTRRGGGSQFTSAKATSGTGRALVTARPTASVRRVRHTSHCHLRADEQERRIEEADLLCRFTNAYAPMGLQRTTRRMSWGPLTREER